MIAAIACKTKLVVVVVVVVFVKEWVTGVFAADLCSCSHTIPFVLWFVFLLFLVLCIFGWPCINVCIYSPYNDRLAITAPIIAGIAFLPSLGGLLGSVVSLTALILFLTTCCCSMNKQGLITTAVFGALAAVASIGLAIGIFVRGDDDEDNDSTGDDEDEDYYNLRPQQEAGILLAGGILWIMASVILFIFICTRYDKILATVLPKPPAVHATIVELPAYNNNNHGTTATITNMTPPAQPVATIAALPLDNGGKQIDSYL